MVTISYCESDQECGICCALKDESSIPASVRGRGIPNKEKVNSFIQLALEHMY